MRNGLKGFTMAAAGAIAFAAAPLMAQADPVGQMTPDGAAMAYLPSQFANSPTTTGPFGDTASLTFDGTGRFIREGRPDTLSDEAADVSPVSGPVVRQARVTNDASERERVDALFAGLRDQLRSLRS